jgi:hypothetical protein
MSATASRTPTLLVKFDDPVGYKAFALRRQ